jgi:hypothetical protein
MVRPTEFGEKRTPTFSFGTRPTFREVMADFFVTAWNPDAVAETVRFYDEAGRSVSGLEADEIELARDEARVLGREGYSVPIR